MKHVSIKMLVLFFFPFQNAFTEDLLLWGDGMGNGGDAVVCQTGEEIKTVELLDYWEGRNWFRPPLLVSLGEEEMAVHQKLEVALKPLQRLSPLRAKRYLKTAELVLDRSVSLYTENELSDVPDSSHLSFPKGCKVEQLAISVEDPLPEEPPFVIQKQLFERAPVNTQVGIALHEAIYQEAVQYHHLNSRRVRFFNAKLGARGLETWTLIDFIGFLREIRFQSTDINGVWYDVDLSTPKFSASSKLVSARLSHGTAVYPIANSDRLQLGCTQVDSTAENRASRVVEFFENGNIRQGTVSGEQTLHTPIGKIPVGLDTRVCDPQRNQITFYPNGGVEKAVVKDDFSFKVQGSLFRNAGEHCMEFSQQGTARAVCVEVAMPVALVTNQGKSLFDRGTYTLYLNEDQVIFRSEKGCNLRSHCAN